MKCLHGIDIKKEGVLELPHFCLKIKAKPNGQVYYSSIGEILSLFRKQTSPKRDLINLLIGGILCL